MTSTQSLAAPITIPLPSSRSPTPVARRIDLPDPEDLPLAPDPSRARSDTICTTSSSSSSPYLQTPETPSIICALASDSPLKPFDRLALSDPESTSRKDSYGFGVLWEDGPAGAVGVAVPVAGPSRHDRSDSEWSMRFVEDETNETDVTDETEVPAPAFVLEPEAQLAWDEEPDGSDVDGDEADESPPDAAEVVGSPETVPTLPNRGSFKAAMRRKLERSKSSLQSLRRASRESEASVDSEGERRRKGRLRSLLSLSRSESSTSIRSFASISTNRASSPAFTHAPSPSPGPNASTSVVVRDYAPTGDYFGHSPLPLAQDVDQVIGKGKGRASGRLSKKSSFAPTPIPPSPLQHASVTALTPGRPRAASMPAHLSLPTKPKVDLFDSMLPRELRVMVMRILVESHPDTGARWDGEAAGRRELIKLSRVSKSWQSLCLDGQLWSLVHLAPFAPHMHTTTIRRIIFHAAPFISSLSLRGMDALGQDALDALESSSLPNLVTLDMRGCRSVTSEDLERIITIAPKLRYLNLKGVQAVSSEAVRCIARYSTQLERLDLSRCWEITLGDIVNLLRNMSDDQANNLRSLRIAGLQSYGRGAVDLLPLIAIRLVNLELLDLHGCQHIHSSDFVRWAAELDKAQRVSPLKHLIISNCQSLTLPVFAQLARRAPHMTRLEMAGLTSVFDGHDGIELELGRMLKSMPLLERLDLDSEGTHEDISDSTIDVLIPGKYSEEIALGKELVELRIGYSKNITGEALVRLIRGCPKLKILEADNMNATNAVMREFVRRRGSADATLSLVDCRTITPQAYNHLAPSTRARRGWTGHAAVPFGYEQASRGPDVNWVPPGDGDFTDKPVLKTFFSWRRVGVPPGWREALRAAEEGEDEEVQEPDKARKRIAMMRSASGSGRRGGWWRADDEFDERSSCAIM